MSKRYKPDSSYPIDLPSGEAFSFDPDAFDDAIRSQGVLFEHWRAIRCPVGMIDRHDTVRRPHEHHEGCQNGFIYTKIGVFQAVLTGNGKQPPEIRDQGRADTSTANVTFPRFYASENQDDEPQRIYLMPYDRLYYADERLLVPNWQLVEASPSGNDRLSFPPIEVLQVVDNLGRRYSPSDLEVTPQGVRWKGPNQPGFDSESDRGRVYTISFLYRPYWYVRQLAHEIRVTQVDDLLTGERRLERMPQEATVQREYIFLNQENDEQLEGDREAPGPADGSFPPR